MERMNQNDWARVALALARLIEFDEVPAEYIETMSKVLDRCDDWNRDMHKWTLTKN